MPTDLFSRRELIELGLATSAVSLVPGAALAASEESGPAATPGPQHTSDRVVRSFTINGTAYKVEIDVRTTLLDVLRERLGLTGTKLGCDRGECGACTVHIDDQPMLSCLVLAAMSEGRKITTIEGLARNGSLHPVQTAFIEHDAFQCGFCTSGQIMSAVACVRERRARSDAEIRERMSGNLCRCGAYPQILAAVRASMSLEPA